jgi:hypothetical protein
MKNFFVIWKLFYIRKEMIFLPEVKFEIKESLGIISESAKGWSKELNLVSWNDRNPKYDIREWSPDHRRMGKGITMSKEELKVLKELIEKAGIE